MGRLHAGREVRIGTACLDVSAVPHGLLHQELVGHDIGWVAGVGVGLDAAEHASDLVLGVDLVREADRLRRRDELVVQRLEAALGGLGRLGGTHEVEGGAVMVGKDAGDDGAEGVHEGVDLVEREPVAHEAAVLGKERLAIARVEVDELSVRPAAVGLGEVIGQLVVGDGHERLDAVDTALLEHAPVELDAGAIGLLVIPLRVDAGPVDREPIDLESHLGEKGDVLLVAVVVVDRLVRRVRETGLDLVGESARHPTAARREVILNARTLAVLVPGAFALVRGRGPAPEEPIGKRAHDLLPSLVSRITRPLPQAPSRRAASHRP